MHCKLFNNLKHCQVRTGRSISVSRPPSLWRKASAKHIRFFNSPDLWLTNSRRKVKQTSHLPIRFYVKLAVNRFCHCVCHANTTDNIWPWKIRELNRPNSYTQQQRGRRRLRPTQGRSLGRIDVTGWSCPALRPVGRRVRQWRR